MAKIYKNAAELVGNTPLLEVGNLEKELGLEARRGPHTGRTAPPAGCNPRPDGQTAGQG